MKTAKSLFSRWAWLCALLMMAAAPVAGGLQFSRPPSVTAADPNKDAPRRFPAPLSPDLPYDVDVPALKALDRDKQVPEAQRLFDTFAWQAFIALNWPAGEDGAADRAKTMADAAAKRVWMGWRKNDTVYLPGGEPPAPWDPRAALNEERVLWRFSKMLNEKRSPENILTDSVQAFTGPLVDQNGVFVRYESYINRPEFDYIVENELYNQDGQIKFVAEKGQPIRFPANQTGPEKRHGSMGVKLAWKQLGPDDLPERFFTAEATVVSTSYDGAGQPVRTKSRQRMGLVGMHVTALTQSAPNWIWATFEHVDNVVANDLEFGRSSKGEQRRVRPNFNNPDLPTKLVNQLPPANALTKPGEGFTSWDEKKTTIPVQLTRVTPIPPATQELNRVVRGLLRDQGSVFQYYELIGTQWPVQPGFPAFGGGKNSAPESIQFKAPGRVVPVYLINTVMESYFQAGEMRAGPLEEDDRLPKGNFADNPSEPVTPDRTRVFGTESCVGCHFSAGAAIGFKRDENGRPVLDPQTGLKVPIYGKNGSFGQTGNAGYVWQLQLKARQKVKSQNVKPQK
ncbi:MAG: hypothetical protein JWO38_8022 [Gemmataceae bacterium]|nr:hypothetical protein [Gemmataceae bacterium]